MNKSGEETILSLPERHNRILALLQQNGSISVAQLAELFKVSEVTIRKDLSYLEQQKKLYRTHGSAILISPYISDRHVNEKEKKNVAEKRAIGAKAASLIAQDDSIIIASGTTMAFLAREIKPVGHLTVITAAVPVTSILSQDANIDVIQLGGITRSSSVSVVGPFAEQMLRHFNCSKLFVGVDAQRGDDERRPESDRAGRQFEVRPSRLQQDLRSGGCRPHHHRQRHSAPLPRTAPRARNRGDRGRCLTSLSATFP